MHCVAAGLGEMNMTSKYPGPDKETGRLLDHPLPRSTARNNSPTTTQPVAGIAVKC